MHFTFLVSFLPNAEHRASMIILDILFSAIPTKHKFLFPDFSTFAFQLLFQVVSLKMSGSVTYEAISYLAVCLC